MGTKIAVVLLIDALLATAQDRHSQDRRLMVQEQIEKRGIRNAEVLRVMRETPRHLFVPERHRGDAYRDGPLPIGSGQTISQPYIVAVMTELLEPSPNIRVLEIGTGSGYQAAVLAALCKEVYTIEIVPELARAAAKIFSDLKLSNIIAREGDGYRGWPEKAPFDRIILTAAPPQVPQALLDQLPPGGKLVAPVGASALDQELIVIEKGKDGKLRRRSVLPVRFVPMVPGK